MLHQHSWAVNSCRFTALPLQAKPVKALVSSSCAVENGPCVMSQKDKTTLNRFISLSTTKRVGGLKLDQFYQVHEQTQWFSRGLLTPG